MPREQLPADEFVRIWQTSKSLAEALERLGMRRKTAEARASRMRGYGVPLRYFGQDWTQIAELARQLATEGKDGTR